MFDESTAMINICRLLVYHTLFFKNTEIDIINKSDLNKLFSCIGKQKTFVHFRTIYYLFYFAFSQ